MADGSLEARQIRLAKNESLFRSINERVEKISDGYTTPGPVNFICECANPDCGATIELSHGEYEAIRKNPTHFFVLSEHVFPEVETIIEDRKRYVVVEKFGAGGRTAAAVSSETVD